MTAVLISDWLVPSVSTCADGAGVCCYSVVVSGAGSGEVTANNSYIRSPGYPDTTATPATYTHTLTRLSSSICQFRLDFEDFSLAKPTSGTGSDGGCDTDHVTFREVLQFKTTTIFIFISNYAVKLGLGQEWSCLLHASYLLRPGHGAAHLPPGSPGGGGGRLPHHRGGQRRGEEEVERPRDPGRASNEGYPKLREDFTITEKAPTRPKQALTPW